MKSDSSLLLDANYNEFFVLSDFFPDPTVYIGHSLLSLVYKFKGYDLRMCKCMISAAGKVKRPLSPSFSHEKHKNHTFYKCPFPCYTDK